MASRREERSDEWAFLGMLIHDMNNSLSALGMGFEFLKLSAIRKLSANDRRCVSKMDMAYCDLRSMVADAADLRGFIKGTARLSADTIDLRAIVKDIVKAIISADPESGHEIRLSVPPSKAVALADKVLIERVIYCFLSSAIKRTHPGGTIKARLWHDRRSAEVRFSVTDPGHQLPPEYLEKVFDPPSCSPGKPPVKSGGASLIFSKYVIEKHGGSVSATSRRTGNTFSFSIPEH